jgi:hypothetical protein
VVRHVSQLLDTHFTKTPTALRKIGQTLTLWHICVLWYGSGRQMVVMELGKNINERGFINKIRLDM